MTPHPLPLAFFIPTEYIRLLSTSLATFMRPSGWRDGCPFFFAGCDARGGTMASSATAGYVDSTSISDPNRFGRKRLLPPADVALAWDGGDGGSDSDSPVRHVRPSHGGPIAEMMALAGGGAPNPTAALGEEERERFDADTATTAVTDARSLTPGGSATARVSGAASMRNGVISFASLAMNGGSSIDGGGDPVAHLLGDSAVRRSSTSTIGGVTSVRLLPGSMPGTLGFDAPSQADAFAAVADKRAAIAAVNAFAAGVPVSPDGRPIAQQWSHESAQAQGSRGDNGPRRSRDNVETAHGNSDSAVGYTLSVPPTSNRQVLPGAFGQAVQVPLLLAHQPLVSVPVLSRSSGSGGKSGDGSLSASSLLQAVGGSVAVPGALGSQWSPRQMLNAAPSYTPDFPDDAGLAALSSAAVGGSAGSDGAASSFSTSVGAARRVGAGMHPDPGGAALAMQQQQVLLALQQQQILQQHHLLQQQQHMMLQQQQQYPSATAYAPGMPFGISSYPTIASTLPLSTSVPHLASGSSTRATGASAQQELREHMQRRAAPLQNVVDGAPMFSLAGMSSQQLLQPAAVTAGSSTSLPAAQQQNEELRLRQQQLELQQHLEQRQLMQQQLLQKRQLQQQEHDDRNTLNRRERKHSDAETNVGATPPVQTVFL